MGNPAAALQNKMAQLRGGNVSGPVNSGFTGGMDRLTGALGKIARPPMQNPIMDNPEMANPGGAGFISPMIGQAPMAGGGMPASPMGMPQNPSMGAMPPPGYTGRGNAVRRGIGSLKPQRPVKY